MKFPADIARVFDKTKRVWKRASAKTYYQARAMLPAPTVTSLTPERREPPLPAGIQEICVKSGQVCVQAAPMVFAGGLELAAGPGRIPFRRMSEDEASAIPFHRAFQLDPNALIDQAVTAQGAKTNPRAVCEARLNAMGDWALANGETVQVQIFDRNAPVELTLGTSVTLRPHATAYQFRVALGIHRAVAEFRLHVTSAETGTTQTSVIPFDQRNFGGKVRNGYQHVHIALPPTDDETTVSMSMAYQSYRETPVENNSPFLFLADPRITSDPLDQPASALGLRIFGTPVEGAQWYQAQVPPPVLAKDPPIEVVAGPDHVPLFSFSDVDVQLREDYGHTLIMSASHSGRYAFYLGGAPAFTAYIGSDPTVIRIPTAHLDGSSRHLTVRDASGTLVFLQTVILTPRILTPEDVLQRESKPPFPGALSVQASHRYDSLKASLAHPGTPADQAQTAWALQVLEGGYDNVKLKPLSFPKVETPDVSIVIPAHNKVKVTYFGLCALLLAKNAASFEVILVDDASTDETAEIEKIVSGITVIHNETAQRFIRACNAGVEKARGKYVVLLNNDTEPTTGWLDALIDAFDRFPNVGLTGSKLIYPNGQLQDAGGIIWGSGNPWNYGNRANPWDPRFSYARQADYLSGAALMTTRAIWDQVGGLSSELEPMYFEDTDLSFKVRDAGYTTWFVPSSVVYHYEGMTSGTDVSTGFKRYQEVNRPKFKRRWAKAYADHGTEGQNPDLEKDRGIVGRVLFIDYTTPRPDRDAGSYAAIQEIRLVQSLGYKVTFLPENLAHLGSYTEALEKDGVEVITAPFYMSVEDFLHARGAEFDAVYITRYYVGQAMIPKIRQVAPDARIILNNADLHFLRQLRTGLAQNDESKIAEAREVRDSELRVMRSADVVLSYNEVEHSVIQSHTDGAVKVMTCPWVVDLPARVPPLKGRAGMSFLGSFQHHPNAEGVEWFVREVMPLLGENRP